jgi:hypothetical protein
MLLYYVPTLGKIKRPYVCVSPQTLPRLPGMQCDEYPYASTFPFPFILQLAFPASTIWVPTAENEAQRDLLRNFYRDKMRNCQPCLFAAVVVP